MLRPMPGSGTPGSVMKSGSAIGIGRMLPWVTSSLSCALAGAMRKSGQRAGSGARAQREHAAAC